jgi:hypothetical protein
MVVAIYTLDRTVETADGRGYPRVAMFDSGTASDGWIEGGDRFAHGDAEHGDVTEAWLLNRYTPPGLTAVQYEDREQVGETIGDPPDDYTLNL